MLVKTQRSLNISKPAIYNVVSTGMNFPGNKVFIMPVGCVSLARYCGKMYNICHLLGAVCHLQCLQISFQQSLTNETDAIF